MSKTLDLSFLEPECGPQRWLTAFVPTRYMSEAPAPTEDDGVREAFVGPLATIGVLHSRAFEGWLDAMDERELVSITPELAPCGTYTVHRYRLNALGRRMLTEVRT